MKKWSNLSDSAKEYINQRFSQYDISGKKAFKESSLFPPEIKELDSEQIIEILKSKDISHVMPTSEYPELYNDINNIFFEDSSINRARGAEIVSENEFEIAKADYSEDIDEALEHATKFLDDIVIGWGVSENEFEIAKVDYFDDINELEESLDILDTLPDILIGSTSFGIGVSSLKAYDKIKKGEIDLFETPRYILVDSGGKIIRCALIGIGVSSGSVIMVSGVFAYVLYRSRNVLSKIFNIARSIPINENAKRIAKGIIRLVESDKYDLLSQKIKKLNKNSLDSYTYLVEDLREELRELEPSFLKDGTPGYPLAYLEGRDNYSLVAKVFNDKLYEFMTTFFWGDGDKPLAYSLTQEQRNSISVVFHFVYAHTMVYGGKNFVKRRMMLEKFSKGTFNQKPKKQEGCLFNLALIFIISYNIYRIYI